ncbi:MAG: hypothetical protein HKN72_12100 [Gemmatimonadetes bacterium]|nr:hypothetical protein [Gemmatimonadota bacterium]
MLISSQGDRSQQVARFDTEVGDRTVDHVRKRDGDGWLPDWLLNEWQHSQPLTRGHGDGGQEIGWTADITEG